MIYLFKIFDNTFIGTLLAGGLLALFGLFLYRRQKEIDIGYEDHKKLRELSSLLFTNINIAMKEFRGQLNIYDGKNSQLKLISDTLNLKFNNYFSKDSDQRFNRYISEIDRSLNNLVAHLKICEKDKNNSKINLLTVNIAKLNVYFLGVFVLGKFNINELNDLEKGFEETVSLVNTTLQELIKQKI